MFLGHRNMRQKLQNWNLNSNNHTDSNIVRSNKVCISPLPLDSYESEKVLIDAQLIKILIVNVVRIDMKEIGVKWTNAWVIDEVKFG